jgi:putative transport protein
VFITRIRHDNVVADASPETIVHRGDVVAVSARTNLLTDFGTRIGPEVHDAEVLDFPIEALDVVVTSKAVAGKTLRELAALDFTRGVFLRKITRVGEAMPFTPETAIDRGDVLNLIGAKPHVDRVARELGYADRPSVATDMVFVGLGILLGGLIGLITVTVGNLPSP